MNRSPAETGASAGANSPEPLLVDKAEAARLLGVSPRTIEAWVARQSIPFVKLGEGKRSALRFRPSDLRAWIEARVVGAEGEKI